MFAGPMGNDEGDSADSFLIRMGQTANFGYAPNKAWPNAFMSTGFDLMNPIGTHVSPRPVEHAGPTLMV